MTNEDGKELKKYNGYESYTEAIYFDSEEEFPNSTVLYVTDELIDFDESDLTNEQIDQVYQFAEEIQQQIRQADFYHHDKIATQYSLYN